MRRSLESTLHNSTNNLSSRVWIPRGVLALARQRLRSRSADVLRLMCRSWMMLAVVHGLWETAGWTRRLGQGLHGLGSWASWHCGRCRPVGVGVDAWLQLSQRQSQLPPPFLAAARLCFVFESHFLAIDSGRRLPALPDVFSGCCGRSWRFAAFSVF